MFEHDGSVPLDVFVQPQAGWRTGEYVAEQCFAHSESLAPQVIAVQLDQVEGV
jgi:hypothetical protein